MANTPEDLERRRLQQRLVELRNQLAEISGGEHQFGPAGEGLGLEQEIAFLEHIIAFETAPRTTWFDILSEAGYDMPDPATLSDPEIGLEVWQVIQRLSELRAYLYNTNHLSDRQLYEYLYQDGLRQETQQMPDDPDSAYHLDLIGSGSEEDVTLFMRYYADEEERRMWLEDFPDFDLPPREKAPFERDHLLPQRTYESSGLHTFLDRLLDADWDDPNGPIRLAADVPHQELEASIFYQTARILLEQIHRAGRVKATQKLGNLSRTFVTQIVPFLPMSDAERTWRLAHQKVFNEENFPLLNKVRHTLAGGSVIRKYRGHFQLTRYGESLLDPARGGELYRQLFLTLFREIDLAGLDGFPPLPVVQSTLAISLWRLSIVARSLTDLDDLAVQTLLPEVLDRLETEELFYSSPGEFLATRQWRHLVEFGLLATNLGPDRPDDEPESYQLTPLFDRFLSFDSPEA